MKQLILSAFLIFSFIGANAQTAGTLTVTANVSYTSPYYYAVWIKNPNGTFLRTLTMYGQTSKYYQDLTHWNADSGTNKTNATTGATKSASGLLTSTWNAKDQANNAVVADGIYTVRIEMSSEQYGTNSKYITTTFTKGPAAHTPTPPTSVSPISGISIKWAPVNTAIHDVELEKLYSVYPNPAISNIYVSGSDVKEVEICSISGKSLIVSREQNINVSALPKGAYLAVIRAKNGTVVKKILKM